MDSRLRGKVWCQFCQLEVDYDAYHCEDCEVCIEEYDHHCVFFSKCIGGGNIYYFWGSIGGVLFNFLNIALILGLTAANHGGLKINENAPVQEEATPDAYEVPIETLLDLKKHL